MTWTDLQPVASLLAGLTALAVFGLSLARERHPLTLIERLGTISESMRSEGPRGLVENYRDERAVLWVLRQRAPRESALLWWGRLTRGLAVIAFIIWCFGNIAYPQHPWFWSSYALAILLGIVSGLLLMLRDRRRSNWMDQEMVWRSIQLSHSASRPHS